MNNPYRHNAHTVEPGPRWGVTWWAKLWVRWGLVQCMFCHLKRHRRHMVYGGWSESHYCSWHDCRGRILWQVREATP